MYAGAVRDNPGRKVVVCTADKKSAIAVHQLLLLLDVQSLVLHQDLSLREVSGRLFCSGFLGGRC